MEVMLEIVSLLANMCLHLFQWICTVLHSFVLVFEVRYIDNLYGVVYVLNTCATSEKGALQ